MTKNKIKNPFKLQEGSKIPERTPLQTFPLLKPRELSSLAPETIRDKTLAIKPLTPVPVPVKDPTKARMVYDKVTGRLKRVFDGSTAGATGMDKVFAVTNLVNMGKGYMGRGLKPPTRSLQDRQDIIGSTQGMNQYAKDSALQGMSNQANTQANNNRSIDNRMNIASTMGTQEGLNNSATQLNAQDSQMYDQSRNTQLQARQGENMRMLSTSQKFQQGLQDEAMTNYKNQQAASQQAINQGQQNMFLQSRDIQAKKEQEKAMIYQSAVGQVQKNVKVNPTADGKFTVSHYDQSGKLVLSPVFNSMYEASIFASGEKASSSIDKAIAEQMEKIRKGMAGFSKGGKMTQSHAKNPFSYMEKYNTKLMDITKNWGAINMKNRNKISLNFKK